ncbi:hypothetical protein VTK56DRAFT_4761 [Thermocarpiscus australiensis]
MASLVGIPGWTLVKEVAAFWHQRLGEYWRRRSPVEIWFDALRNASTFDEWEEAALHLDNLLGLDLWRSNFMNTHYDYYLIHDRLTSIETARDRGDVHSLVNLLRSGMIRNLGNITAPRLYNCSFAGTKFLIEEYVSQVARSIEEIGLLPTPSDVATKGCDDGDASWSGGSESERQRELRHANRYANGRSSGFLLGPEKGAPRSVSTCTPRVAMRDVAIMSTQMKLDFIHDTRQAFGRSALLLQGGAIFGLCHLGVVKALYLRGLLPRIIVGTATGALIASLVAVHPENELPTVLKGDGIDLSAFESGGRDPAKHNASVKESMWTRFATLARRLDRFNREGYFLDVKVLEECIRSNVGDLTFEEAYHRSKRVLNITVATDGRTGVPTLLNYLTAPNVLIWTAAVASNASTAAFGERQTKILCKDSHGNVVPWKPATTATFRHWTQASQADHESPLLRVAELFNVNHFIVSQARPYLIPFLQSDMHGPSNLERGSMMASAMASMMRLAGIEMRHRLRQLDKLQLLSPSIRRLLMDEQIPGASVTLVPEVKPSDFWRLMETPTIDTVNYWILKGERSVWPAVAALKIRCTIEMELDRAYQQARRLKAGELRRQKSTEVKTDRREPARREPAKRDRSLSMVDM